MDSIEKKSQVTRLMDLQELADLWRLSPHTIRAMVKAGRLHPTRICRRLLFEPSECTRFLEASTRSPETQEPNAPQEVVAR